MEESNDFFFAPDEGEGERYRGSWNILIVDDEVQVHEMTKLSMKDFKYAHKNLYFTSVYSAKEAIALLSENENFAIIILDIMMENSSAGLDVVEFIRNTLKNRTIRIIIRSGEHGQKSQRYIVDNYDINDYREKAELSIDQLYTSIRTALVQYEQISELSQTKSDLLELNQGLQKCINKAVSKHKEEQVEEFQHSRLVQMNELLNMLAHQWRQPLSRISTTVANIKLHIALDTYKICEIDHELGKVDEHIQDLSKTINSFRSLYQIDTKEEHISRLDKILRNTVNLMQAIFDDDSYALELNIDCDMPDGSVEISQVFLNIIKNAYEEMCLRKIEDGKLKISAFEKDENIHIEFLDNAGGVDPEIMDKIFDPYFSTKVKRHGIGLGLYSCKVIVQEKYQGELFCENRLKGSCFCIVIPKRQVS